MLSAINVAKSKSISIAFIALKSMILGLILCTVFEEVSDESCSSSLESLAEILKVFYLLGSILDGIALIYFYCTQDFSRLQYYVFYFYHVLLAVVSIFIALGKLGNGYDCRVGHQFLVSLLALAIIFHVSAVILMWSTLYFGLKYAHFGSNLIWPLMWYLEPQHCGSTLVAVIAFLHGLMSVICLINFVSMFCLNKTTFSAKLWRYLTFISLVVMLICYLIIILGFLVPESCEEASFFIKSYQRYGLLELISPILLLMFLRLETGDPREKVMKRHHEVFTKAKENVNAQNQQKE